MSAATFDTLTVACELKSAGIEAEHAAAIAGAARRRRRAEPAASLAALHADPDRLFRATIPDRLRVRGLGEVA